jgi:3-phenylpropionate/cinnamic acid dioxygenase small subunit
MTGIGSVQGATVPVGGKEVSWSLWMRVQQLLCRESDAVDMQRWDEWLSLFADDVEYWVPAWDSEFDLTTDPMSEVSLIYITSKADIADRLWRFTSGQSAASVPLPRTVHHVTNVDVVGVSGELVKVRGKWLTHAYRFRESTVFGGYCEYVLRNDRDNFVIQKKKSVLVNDRPIMAVDLYHF